MYRTRSKTHWDEGKYPRLRSEDNVFAPRRTTTALKYEKLIKVVFYRDSIGSNFWKNSLFCCCMVWHFRRYLVPGCVWSFPSSWWTVNEMNLRKTRQLTALIHVPRSSLQLTVHPTSRSCPHVTDLRSSSFPTSRDLETDYAITLTHERQAHLTITRNKRRHQYHKMQIVITKLRWSQTSVCKRKGSSFIIYMTHVPFIHLILMCPNFIKLSVNGH